MRRGPCSVGLSGLAVSMLNSERSLGRSHSYEFSVPSWMVRHSPPPAPPPFLAKGGSGTLQFSLARRSCYVWVYFRPGQTINSRWLLFFCQPSSTLPFYTSAVYSLNVFVLFGLIPEWFLDEVSKLVSCLLCASHNCGVETASVQLSTLEE